MEVDNFEEIQSDETIEIKKPLKEMEEEQAEVMDRELDYFKDRKVLELAKINFPNTTNQHYVHKTFISNDCTCILAAVNAKGMYVSELPSDLYNVEEISEEREITMLKPAIFVKQMNIYDMCWNPLLNSAQPETCYWLATSQDEPLKLFDAYNGGYKCSYRVHDYADEMEAAISCQFSPDGSIIYAGTKKSIAVFNTDIPGRDYDSIPIKQPISCLATNYYESMLAAGSWSKKITLIDTRDYLTIDTLQGHRQGVTFVKFSSNGQNLFSGSRKDSNLLMWDLRNTSLPLYRFQRRVDNNQKVHFDVSYNSNFLVSGDTRGIVHVWNLKDLNEDAFPKEDQYQLHSDSCTGISMHSSFLATSSGQFKFGTDLEDENSEKEIVENSLVLWWIGATKRLKNKFYFQKILSLYFLF